ncbi:MAG: hypothetical protein WBQ26_11355 [Gemmatimonadaceae bacterium]|nr:hypothetical protein [Gemmatimonadaceae bacterium]
MAGLKLDGAGQAKLKTLDDATTILHRIHGLVEQYALAVKRQTPTSPYFNNLKRQLPALGGLLKGQFGVISDQVFAITLAISRGSSEPTRIRQMREGVAQLTQALELTAKQVVEKHSIHDEEQPDHAGG